MKILKGNILSVVLLLASGSVFIYSLYNGFHMPITDNTIKVNNILKLDSLKSKLEQDYRFKLDSTSSVYNNEIHILKSKNKELNERLKELNTDIGDLPDFK